MKAAVSALYLKTAERLINWRLGVFLSGVERIESVRQNLIQQRVVSC